MNHDQEQQFVDQEVTYIFEADGAVIVIEGVPARVDRDTGERFFAPETVEQLQAIIATDELTSLLETAHLLKSPANAERLLAALGRALQRTGTPQSIASLRTEVGMDRADG